MLNPFLSMIIIRMNVFAFLFVKEQIRAFFCWYLWTTEKGITNGEKWHTNTKQKNLNLNLKVEVGQRDKWRKQIDRWKWVMWHPSAIFENSDLDNKQLHQYHWKQKYFWQSIGEFSQLLFDHFLLMIFFSVK
jgi:hypothetical protein